MIDRTTSGTVVVFTGGDPVRNDLARFVPSDAFVVAADSGLHTALAFGQRVDVAVGDFDSASPDALAAASDAGTRIERHPRSKDQTDLELGLDRAIAQSPERIVVIGGYGGRLDHFLGNVLVLASDRYRESTVEAHLGDGRVYVVRDSIELNGRVGELLTLLPVHGAAHGVTTDGLRFPLTAETLEAGSTRGVSNEFVAPTASVRIDAGVVLAVAPGVSVTSPDPSPLDSSGSSA